VSKIINPNACLRVFICAARTDRERAQTFAKALRSHDCDVASSWQDDEDALWEKIDLQALINAKDDKQISEHCTKAHKLAAKYFQEIMSADWVAVLRSPDRLSIHGITHLLLGFAIGIRKNIVLIGLPDNNPFELIPAIKQVDTESDFLMGLTAARVKGEYMAKQAEKKMADMQHGPLPKPSANLMDLSKLGGRGRPPFKPPQGKRGKK